jgi:hypothetical protein
MSEFIYQQRSPSYSHVSSAQPQPKSAKEYRQLQVQRDVEQHAALNQFLAGLAAQYGYTLQCTIDRSARNVSIPRPGWDPGYVYCQVTLQDGAVIDPCMLVRHPVEGWAMDGLMNAYSLFTVGGVIQSVKCSAYILPRAIREQTVNTIEYRMGSYEPLLVAIGGETKYLVPGLATFFTCGQYRGPDVDPGSGVRPSNEEHKKGYYLWGDDMEAQVTICFAEISDG